MPTGYTHKVQNGTVTDFDEFATNCARAFGACIMQRDDPADAPIKLEEPSEHYERSLKDARESLEELRGLTEEEVNTRFKKYVLDQRVQAHQGNQKKKVEKERYEAMLEQVREWTPPTMDHQTFKAFMTDQLIDSIKWDCDTTFYDNIEEEVETLTVKEWYDIQIASAERSIEYNAKSQQEEITRVNDRNNWKLALFKSIGKELV